MSNKNVSKDVCVNQSNDFEPQSLDDLDLTTLFKAAEPEFSAQFSKSVQKHFSISFAPNFSFEKFIIGLGFLIASFLLAPMMAPSIYGIFDDLIVTQLVTLINAAVSSGMDTVITVVVSSLFDTNAEGGYFMTSSLLLSLVMTPITLLVSWALLSDS